MIHADAAAYRGRDLEENGDDNMQFLELNELSCRVVFGGGYIAMECAPVALRAGTEIRSYTGASAAGAVRRRSRRLARPARMRAGRGAARS